MVLFFWSVQSSRCNLNVTCCNFENSLITLICYNKGYESASMFAGFYRSTFVA